MFRFLSGNYGPIALCIKVAAPRQRLTVWHCRSPASSLAVRIEVGVATSPGPAVAGEFVLRQNRQNHQFWLNYSPRDPFLQVQLEEEELAARYLFLERKFATGELLSAHLRGTARLGEPAYRRSNSYCFAAGEQN